MTVGILTQNSFVSSVVAVATPEGEIKYRRTKRVGNVYLMWGEEYMEYLLGKLEAKRHLTDIGVDGKTTVR
jgi:hypothetical protein